MPRRMWRDKDPSPLYKTLYRVPTIISSIEVTGIQYNPQNLQIAMVIYEACLEFLRGILNAIPELVKNTSFDPDLDRMATMVCNYKL